jgi:hypothetical protein
MLFTHRHSKDLHERQVATIYRLCKHYKEGFYVNDLKKLNQILGFVSTLISEGFDEFVGPVCQILKVSCFPFIKETASEEYRNFSHLSETIMLIGRFLGSTDVGLQNGAGEMLVTYASTPYVEDGQAAPVSYHHQILEKSQVADSLAIGFGVRGAQSAERTTFMLLLRLSLELSRTPELCSQLLRAGCLPAVLDAIGLGFKTEAASTAVEVLWNALDTAVRAASAGGPPPDGLDPDAVVGALGGLLEALLQDGHRAQDKQLRNEALVLCQLCAAHLPASRPAFAARGLLPLLLTAAVAAEVGAPGVKPFVTTAAPDDLEFKLGVLHLAAVLAADPTCAAAIAAHRPFVPGLLVHLDVRLADAPARARFSRPQSRQIQARALAALARLAPHDPDGFRAHGGPGVVLELLMEQSEESIRSGCLAMVAAAAAAAPELREEFGSRAVAMMVRERDSQTGRHGRTDRQTDRQTEGEEERRRRRGR